MPKVTFSMPAVVAVKILGEGGRFPVMPDDGGLVSRFLKWMLDAEVFPAISTGHSGGGGYLGFFEKKEAVKIRKWLEDNGAIEDDEKTWGSGRW